MNVETLTNEEQLTQIQRIARALERAGEIPGLIENVESGAIELLSPIMTDDQQVMHWVAEVDHVYDALLCATEVVPA